MEHWRVRLGARLLVERVQRKKWNYVEAARAADIDSGTVRRIEQGANYEIVKLEMYAESLGRPLDAWLREILAIPDDLIERLADWNKDESKKAGEGKSPTRKRRHAEE
jgi:transcriptional regulator with XRE-family HTH domain